VAFKGLETKQESQQRALSPILTAFPLGRAMKPEPFSDCKDKARKLKREKKIHLFILKILFLKQTRKTAESFPQNKESFPQAGLFFHRQRLSASFVRTAETPSPPTGSPAGQPRLIPPLPK
jgi:hypothetical protein